MQLINISFPDFLGKYFSKTGIFLIPLYLFGCSAFNPLASIPPKFDGIASDYNMDKGIRNDENVIFFDDFESWGNNTEPPQKTWQVKKPDGGRTSIVLNNGNTLWEGKYVVELACWKDSGGQVAGIYYKLGNYDHPNEGLGDGYEEIFIRYYIKFDTNYRIVKNHGVNIGGRDVNNINAAWVGMAGIKDISTSGYFFSGLEPAGLYGDQSIEFDLYSYHLDRRGGWGEHIRQQRSLSIGVGKWHCIERHMKLNTIDHEKNKANYDGIEEVWIDGQLVMQITNIRYRTTPNLRITFFSLETYYHSLPGDYTENNPIKVNFDNVVIASKYIGPM